MNKFKIFSSHVESGWKLEEHTSAVNNFLETHKIIKVTHNFDDNKYESWFACALSQIVVTTIEYEET